MLVVLWVALAVSVVAPAWAAVSAGRNAVRAWRAFRDFRRGFAGATGAVVTKLERLAEHASSAPAHGPELETSRRRLDASLARLAVLRGAADEASDAVGRVTVFYPRK
jgi:hypothetical protein